MVSSLERLCCQKIIKFKINDLDEKINQVCYNKIEEERIKEGLKIWKQNIKIVNLEIEIDCIEVTPDMFWHIPKIIIEIKNKNSIFREIYHPWGGCYNKYKNYYQIAEKRGLLDDI